MINSAVLGNKWIKKDYLGVGLVGLLLLMISYTVLYRGATLSDEVLYTVVARNILEQQTLNTNVYRADSVVFRGYPARDHHMAGYMILLAGMYALFGINQWAVGLPSQVAYLLAGLIFYGLGKKLFRPGIAFWATVLFYLYPVSFMSASLVLVEAPLHLIAVIFLVYLLKINQADRPQLLDAGILASILILGMTFRETFIIFLLPAGYSVARPVLRHRDYRPLMMFGMVFGILFAGIFWPLAQHRGYYPFPLNEILVAESWPAQMALLKETLQHHFSLFARPLDGHYASAVLNLLLGILITFLGLKYLYSSHKQLVILFLYLFWPTMLLLTTLHTPVVDWATPRHLYTFFLPGWFLLVAALFQINRPRLRYGALVLMIILVAIPTIWVSRNTVRYQLRTIAYQEKLSDLVSQHLKPYNPQTLLIRRAFTPAWDHYPITLIWSFPEDYEQMRILDERLPVDAMIVFNEEQRDIVLGAGAAGLLKQRYISLFPYKVDGYYFLVSEQLQLKAEASR